MPPLLDRIEGLDTLDVASRRVLVRVDLDVPMDGDRVADDARIREALPTLRHLIAKGARVILAAHLGAPRRGHDPRLSLAAPGERLAELLGMDIVLTDDCVGDGARKVVHDLRDGRVALLENLRFHPEEEANDDGFARGLAQLMDVYVNDALGASHRAHASVEALARLARVRAAGLLMHRELTALGRLVAAPERPYVAVLGGARVSEKLPVIEALLPRVDAILVGGAMANTLLAGRGARLGKSVVEDTRLALARDVIARATERRLAVVLPTDLVVATDADEHEGRAVLVDAVPHDAMALDVGPRTVELFRTKLLGARTVFWNGPMGMFEDPAFAAGTVGVARAIADTAGFTVVGGRDTVAAVQQAGLASRFAHVSTGDSASLALIEGRRLPGVEALRT